jgi:hypothetical protein
VSCCANRAPTPDGGAEHRSSPGRPVASAKVQSRRPRLGLRPLRLVGPVTVQRIVPDTLWESIALALPPNPTHARAGRLYADDRAVLAGIICTETVGCSQARIPPSLEVLRYTCSTRLSVWRRAGPSKLSLTC